MDDSTAADTVREHAPFVTWMDIPATYGEVFDKFITGQEWTVSGDDDIVLVKVDGSLTGSGERVSFTIELSDDSDILPGAASLTGFTIESRADVLSLVMSFFIAYNDGFDHYMDMLKEEDIRYDDEWLYGLWAFFWGEPVQYIGNPGFIEFTPEGSVIVDESDMIGTWRLDLNILKIIRLDLVEYAFTVEFRDESITLEDQYYEKIAFILY